MARLLAIWLTLLAAFWLTRALSSAVIFGTADRSYEGVLQLVAVPAVQALLVAWATRRPGPFAHALPLRAALRQRDLRAILLLDAAVLALGWLLGAVGGAGWFHLSQGRNLPSTWIAVKAGAAGVILFLDCRGLSGERGEERRRLLGFAAALLALALMILFDVLRPLPAFLLPGRPRLLGWLLVHGVLFAAGTGLALGVQRLFRRGHAAAALALDWAVGLALLAGLAAALQLFQRPYLTEPWGSFAATCNSLAVTALLAAVLLARPLPPQPNAID